MISKNFTTGSLVFLFTVIMFFYLLTKIPFASLFVLFTDEVTAFQVRNVTISIIVIGGSYYWARRCSFLKEGGFILYRGSNFWMLLVPFIFPGTLFFSNLFQECFFKQDEWILLSLIIILKAIMEEALCRGLILGYMIKNFPQVSYLRIVFISAVIFALFHYIGLSTFSFFELTNQAVYALMMGLLFGALLVRVQNLWALGIVHGGLNIMSKSCDISETATKTVMIGEYLAGLAVLILIFSPAILIYWLLLKTNVDRRMEKANRM